MSSEGNAVPCHPADLTAGWMTEALREANILRDAFVSDVVWEIIGEEWGFTGVVARVVLQYSRLAAEAPRSLVAKFPMAVQETPSLYARAAGRDEQSRHRAYQRAAREVHAYRDLLPEQLAAAPAAYYCSAESERGCIVLLLEDLAAGTPGDVLRGCSPVQAGSVLGAIVPFHARWWESAHLEALAWLSSWGQDLAARAGRYGECVASFLDRFGDRMTAEARDLVHLLTYAYLPLLSELAGAPWTALHGDLHLDNVIFTREDDQRVRLIEWQGVMRGPAVLDLTLVANSLSVEERPASEPELLRHYHATLRANGIVDYSYDLLERHYRLALLSNLAGFVTWLGSADLDGLAGRQRAMVDAVVEAPRLLTALGDPEVKRLLG